MVNEIASQEIAEFGWDSTAEVNFFGEEQTTKEEKTEKKSE